MTPLLAAKDLTTYYGLNPNFTNAEQYMELEELGDTKEFTEDTELSLDKFAAIEEFVTEARERGVALGDREAYNVRRSFGAI